MLVLRDLKHCIYLIKKLLCKTKRHLIRSPKKKLTSQRTGLTITSPIIRNLMAKKKRLLKKKSHKKKLTLQKKLKLSKKHRKVITNECFFKNSSQVFNEL